MAGDQAGDGGAMGMRAGAAGGGVEDRRDGAVEIGMIGIDRAVDHPDQHRIAAGDAMGLRQAQTGERVLQRRRGGGLRRGRSLQPVDEVGRGEEHIAVSGDRRSRRGHRPLVEDARADHDDAAELGIGLLDDIDLVAAEQLLDLLRRGRSRDGDHHLVGDVCLAVVGGAGRRHQPRHAVVAATIALTAHQHRIAHPVASAGTGGRVFRHVAAGHVAAHPGHAAHRHAAHGHVAAHWRHVVAAARGRSVGRRRRRHLRRGWR